MKGRSLLLLSLATPMVGHRQMHRTVFAIGGFAPVYITQSFEVLP